MNEMNTKLPVGLGNAVLVPIGGGGGGEPPGVALYDGAGLWGIVHVHNKLLKGARLPIKLWLTY